MKGPLPEEILDEPVTGINLVPGSLRDQLAPKGTLFVFLRFFGCIFCREMIADVRAAAEADAGFPKVIFFFQASTTEGRGFLRRYWPSVAAVSDPERRFYAAFGIDKGSFLQTLGPKVFRARRRALAKGHEQGPRGDDIWRMPGVFLVKNEAVVWAHEFGHAGEAPDFARIPEIAAASA